MRWGFFISLRYADSKDYAGKAEPEEPANNQRREVRKAEEVFDGLPGYAQQTPFGLLYG